MKRICIMLMAAIMSVCMTLMSASASSLDSVVWESDTTLVQSDDDGIQPYAASAPDYKTLCYLGIGDYEGELDNLAANRGSYTRYCFVTSTKEMNISLSFYHSGDPKNVKRTLEVQLYVLEEWRDDGNNIHYADRLLKSQTITCSPTSTETPVEETALFRVY